MNQTEPKNNRKRTKNYQKVPKRTKNLLGWAKINQNLQSLGRNVGKFLAVWESESVANWPTES